MQQLENHDGLPFDLVERVRQNQATVLIVFRGTWCPYCRAYWEDLAEFAAAFDAEGAKVIGLCADKPKKLRKFIKKKDLPFEFVSDPKLWAAKALRVKKERNHPKSGDYKKNAFLLPATFIWTSDGKLHYQWSMGSPDFTNAFGAGNRPSPKKILAKLRAALHPEPAPEEAAAAS